MDLTAPSLPVPDFVLLPGCTVTLQIGHPELLGQVRLAAEHRNFLWVRRDHASAQMGCLAEVRSVTRNATGYAVHLVGLQRFRSFIEMHTARGVLAVGQIPQQIAFQGDLPELAELPKMVAELRGQVAPELWLDMAAFHLPLSPDHKQALLAQVDPNLRARYLQECPAQPKPKLAYCAN